MTEEENQIKDFFASTSAFYKLKNFIIKSPLSKEDKKFWLNSLPRLSSEEIKSLVQIITANPKELIDVNKNLKRKIEILKNKDIQAWQRLFEQEKKEVNYEKKH